MAITFLDEEDDIVTTAEPQKGKSRITFLDKEEPLEAVKPEPEVLATPSGRKITFLDEEPITPAKAQEQPSSKNRQVSLEPPTFESLGIELPKPPPPPESILRQAADVPVQFAIGVNNSVKGLTDLFGADNPISQNLNQNVDWYRSILSASAKQDEEEIARILAEAEDAGIGGQIAAGLEAFTVAPVDFVASGLGSLATFAVGGAAARAAGFGARGIQAVQAGLGIGMGAGIAKGEIYQSVKDEMLSQGKTESEAKSIAMEAQSYGGKNLDQILIAGGLGAIEAATGANKIISKVLTKGGVAPDASRVGNILLNGITEGAPEFVQAAQEKFASNLALQREGVDVSLTQGVFSQGALEGLTGVALGMGAGALEPRVATPPKKEEIAAAAAETQDVARQNKDVAPATADIVERQAETITVNATVSPRREGETDQQWRARIEQEREETPEQRVARLQREAQEAAGDIELEEEVPVSGLVEEPVTPTPEAPPVAPVAPVVPAEGAQPPVTPEVVPKAENAVVEAEQKSEQESDTVKVFRGVAEAGALPTGGAFFTDSERDASAYAQLAALRKAVEDNDDFNDIVSDIMAEEGANDITDLSISTIKSIIEGNNIQVGDISEGAVLRGNIRLGNVLNLESFGSEVGSLPETWNELNELGLVSETWQDLDEDVQDELSDKYRGKAFYSLLEGEVNLNEQFAKGIDTIVFTDQNTEGKGTHRTYLTKAAEQFSQEPEAAPVTPTPTEVAPVIRKPDKDIVDRIIEEPPIDESNTFGKNAVTIRFTDPETGGYLTVVDRKDGNPVDVIYFQVPKDQRRKGVGMALQARALKEFPDMRGQVSSKTVARSAYALGRRPTNNPDATLDETLALIDEYSSVNMQIPTAEPPTLAPTEPVATTVPQQSLMGESLERSNPLGLVVAVKKNMEGGRIVVGKAGDIHADIPFTSEDTLGFATKDGRFLTREEAASEVAKFRAGVEAAPEAALPSPDKRTQNAINRILDSDDTDKLKFLKLTNLALKAFPSSPNQKAIQAAAERFRPAPEARESRREPVTPQQDRDYLDAVERGDSGTDNLSVLLRASKAEDRPSVYQQWMERNPRTAAKIQKVADDSAKRGPFGVASWHGSPTGKQIKEDRSFDPAKLGVTTGAGSAKEAFFFAKNIGTSAEYAIFDAAEAPFGDWFWQPKNLNDLLGHMRDLVFGANVSGSKITPDASLMPDSLWQSYGETVKKMLDAKTPEERRKAYVDFRSPSKNARAYEDVIESVSERANIEAIESIYEEESHRLPEEYYTLKKQADEKRAELKEIARPSISKWAEQSFKDIPSDVGAKEGITELDRFKKLLEKNPEDQLLRDVVERKLEIQKIEDRIFDITEERDSRVVKKWDDLSYEEQNAFIDKYGAEIQGYESDVTSGSQELAIFKDLDEQSLPLSVFEWERGKEGQQASIDQYYLRMDNPLIKRFEGYRDEKFIEIINKAKAEGYDSVIFENIRDGGGFDTIYAVFNPEQIKSAETITWDDAGNIIPPSQRFQPTEADIRYSYAGVRAQTPQFMRDSLSVAQAMAAKGEDAETIRSVTGWIVNPYDGKLRWEIPDNNISFTKNIDSTKPYLTLGEVLNHDAFFEAYPDAKNILFQKVLLKNNIGAYFDPQRNKITLNSSMSGTEQLSSTLHEIQHWIQKREGFAQGSSPEEFIYDASFQLSEDSQKKVDELELEKTELRKEESELGDYFRSLDNSQKGVGKNVKESRRLEEISYRIRDINDAISKIINPEKSRFALEKYVRTAGEIESRDVQARMAMTPEQRKAAAPYSSENISPEDAIVMGGEGGVAALRPTGMTTDAVRARLEALGFGVEGMIRVVEDPQAAFEGRTIIQDGKAVRIELNASALRSDADIDRVLNHEFAEAANADGALDSLVEKLSESERKEINDTIIRLGYSERARTAEQAARAVEILADAWRGRGWFDRAVARVEAWASKIGFKVSRRAAEYIAARNVANINDGFKSAYNRFINVRGEAREGRAFVTPEENARFMELAKDPEGNREELQRMVDGAGKRAGASVHTPSLDVVGVDRESIKQRIESLTEREVEVTDAMLDEAIEFVNSLPDTILVYRAVRADNREGVDVEMAGESWTIDGPTAYQFGIHNGSNFVIVGQVNKSDMALNDMVSLYVEFSSAYDADSEFEVKIPRDWDVVKNKHVITSRQARSRPYFSMKAYDLNGQIKSADPVTYDDQGNIIPLDQRFQPAEADIRYSRTEIRESRREPAFTEESPEAKTLSTMRAAMEKVDAASEAKGGKPETQKISEIAANWMEQGGDTRALQDAIVENTNLSPANAQKVANAIARQYRIQESIAETLPQTAEGISVEGLPEGATIPPEVDPKQPKTVLQRVIDATTGVRTKPVKLEVNEKTVLKQQIRLKAASFRQAKKAQKEQAAEVVEAIKAMDIRGGIRPKQAAALMKRAALINFASEKSVDNFIAYAEKTIANANYDKDLADAKLAQKRAKELTKRTTIADNQKEVLRNTNKIEVSLLEDPREFADAVNHYLRGFKNVVSPDYLVVPDAELDSYLSAKKDEAENARAEIDFDTISDLAAKYGVPVSEVNNVLNAQDVEATLATYANRVTHEGLISDKAKDSLLALRNYDPVGLTNTQKKLIDRLLTVDADSLNMESKVQMIRSVDNILVNNQTLGLQKFVDIAEGQSRAVKAAKDKTFKNQMPAWVNVFSKKLGEIVGRETLLFGSESQRKLALSVQSIADTFRNVFGKDNLGKIKRLMGFYDLERGTQDFNTEMNKISETFAEFFSQLEKKFGAKAVSDTNGLYAEGVVGYLIQKFPNKSESDSITTRRSVIMEDIAERRRSGDRDQIADAQVIEDVLNKLDGNSVGEIMNNLKREFPANHESVVWMKDKFLPQYKEFLKNFDENYNNQANNYDNSDYLPIKYKFRRLAEIAPEDAKKFYDTSSLTPKQASNTIKRIDYTTLPKIQGNPASINYNLRSNVFSSLGDQLKRAYTSSGWTQVDAFMNSRAALEVFGNEANVGFVKERLKLLKDSQDRKTYERDGASQLLDATSVLARKVGIGIALGGYGQALKQAPDQMATTIANTGRPDLQNQNTATLIRSKDSREEVMQLLKKFAIGTRGDAAMGGAKFTNQMESSFSNLERFLVGGNWAKAKFYANKVADTWLILLKQSDFLAAASGWMTYYQVGLEKAGVEFKGWGEESKLVDSDPARQEAAAYAEAMIDIYQGSSDPTRMATFAQRGKTGYENAFKTIFLPFNSFVLQQRIRMLSDLREIKSKSTDPKSIEEAKRGLAGTLAGILIFHSIRRYAIPALSGLGAAAIYAMLGVDPEEPDEEKQQAEASFRLKQFYSEIAGNILVGGFGGLVEQQTLEAMNQAAYLTARSINSDWVLDDSGDVMEYDKWKKDKAPFWYYQDFKSGYDLGMFNIGFDQLSSSIEAIKKMNDPELMDSLTPEERRVIYLMGLSEWLYLMRLNDADVARMIKRMGREVESTSKEREKEIKRIMSGR